MATLSQYTNSYDGDPRPLIAATGTPSTRTPFGVVEAEEVVIMVGDQNLVDILNTLLANAGLNDPTAI